MGQPTGGGATVDGLLPLIRCLGLEQAYAAMALQSRLTPLASCSLLTGAPHAMMLVDMVKKNGGLFRSIMAGMTGREGRATIACLNPFAVPYIGGTALWTKYALVTAGNMSTISRLDRWKRPAHLTAHFEGARNRESRFQTLSNQQRGQFTGAIRKDGAHLPLLYSVQRIRMHGWL